MKKELWERIREARKIAGISQSDLAAHFGLSRVAVGLWETANAKDRTTPSTEQLRTVAKVLGVTLTWLIEGGDPSRVSLSDATIRDDRRTGVRRVRIEGTVGMDENGFWETGSSESEGTPYPTDDPDAYAIRVMNQRFQPVMASGQCILVSPRAEVKPGRPAVVTLTDGRRTLRTFLSHDRGVWNFTSVTDGNLYLDLSDDEVSKVERVMAYLWTD